MKKKKKEEEEIRRERLKKRSQDFFKNNPVNVMQNNNKTNILPPTVLKFVRFSSTLLTLNKTMGVRFAYPVHIMLRVLSLENTSPKLRNTEKCWIQW